MEPKDKALLTELLPEQAIPILENLIPGRGIKIHFTRNRSSKLGDYRPPYRNRPFHGITVNTGMSRELTLLVLLHELAHLSVFEKYGRTREPHGINWKKEYSALISNFLDPGIFPPDILEILKNMMAAGQIRSRFSPKIMAHFRPQKEMNGKVYLRDIPENAQFIALNRQPYIKMEKIRTRYRCKNLVNGRMYLFNGLAEVAMLQ